MASAGDRRKRPSSFPSPTPGRRSTPPPSPGSMEEEEEASAKMRRAWKGLREFAARHQPYMYLSIADALKVIPGQKVCLFAVVCEIGAAVQSRGTDFTVTLRIADRSRTTGISVTFFADSTALLPCVKSSGDVISLHDVVITKYGEDFCVTFKKISSSFALFERKVSAECMPYQTSIGYHRTKHDTEHLTQMRTWVPENPLGLKGLELQLRSLKSDSTFDLVCKVLHVHGDNDNWTFYIWDGTDTPAAELQAISDAEAVESPLLLEEPPLPREVLCKMPCVGTVLKIVSNRFVKEVAHMKNSIYWARFWNITCKQEFGIWKGFFLDSSGVHLLSDEDGSVVDRLKMYDNRNTNEVHRRPMASSPSNVADADNKKGHYSTLMESLTHKEYLLFLLCEVTHIVKTLVRVVAAYPCGASELPLLSTGDYCILLTLEDPTARIHACVDKKGLVKFFGGFPTKEVVMEKMKKLLGVPEPEDSEEAAPLTRNPPWIWCCLKSYYLKENDPWGSRRYQIFATTIRD